MTSARRCAAWTAALALCAASTATLAAKPPLAPPLKPPTNSTNKTLASVVAAVSATAPRVLGDVGQVDVPFNYGAYFNKYLTSDCMPATATTNASTGFPGSCPGTLPWSDPRIAPPIQPCAPEQVALKWWGTAAGGPAVVISWATCPSAYVMAAPAPPADPAAAPSVVRLGKAPGVYDETFRGVSTTYTMDYNTRLNGSPSSPPGGIYRSPYIHHVRIGPLVPGATYFYEIDGPPGTAPYAGQFKVPGGGFPMRMATIADIGQTYNTSASLDFLLAAKPDVLVLPGDLTYADNDKDWNMYYDWTQAAAIYDSVNTFSPRWDSWGRLLSPIASHVPIITAPGNHEVEATPENARTPTNLNNFNNTAFFTRFGNYLPRFSVPQTRAQALNGPSVADLAPITPADDQGRGLYYATKIEGVATILSISSYTFGENYTESDAQYQWLKAELAAIDRKKTPWVVVVNHVSWYSSALLHTFEGSCMLALYEPLFRQFGVDVVFSGHDHAYEFSGPVYNFKMDPDCGTVYINVGYNGDEVNFGWMDQYAYLLDPANAWQLEYLGFFSKAKLNTCPAATNPAAPTTGGYTYSPPPYTPQAPGQWGAGGRCVTSWVQGAGTWCPSAQPQYSRFRELVYGAGYIDFESPTKAVWSFYSQGTAMVKPAHRVVITRGNPKCPAAQQAAAKPSAADIKADLLAAANATLAAKAAGAALALDAGKAGIVRGVGDSVAAKVSTANWTVTTWANALRNKTGMA